MRWRRATTQQIHTQNKRHMEQARIRSKRTNRKKRMRTGETRRWGGRPERAARMRGEKIPKRRKVETKAVTQQPRIQSGKGMAQKEQRHGRRNRDDKRSEGDNGKTRNAKRCEVERSQGVKIHNTNTIHNK